MTEAPRCIGRLASEVIKEVHPSPVKALDALGSPVTIPDGDDTYWVTDQIPARGTEWDSAGSEALILTVTKLDTGEAVYPDYQDLSFDASKAMFIIYVTDSTKVEHGDSSEIITTSIYDPKDGDPSTPEKGKVVNRGGVVTLSGDPGTMLKSTLLFSTGFVVGLGAGYLIGKSTG